MDSPTVSNSEMNKEEVVKCPCCPKSWIRRRMWELNLKRHFVNVHLSKEVLKEVNTVAEFLTLTSSSTPKRRKGEPRLCPYCPTPNTFFSRSGLSGHWRRMHKEVEVRVNGKKDMVKVNSVAEFLTLTSSPKNRKGIPRLCPSCTTPTTFFSRSGLSGHLKKMHKDEVGVKTGGASSLSDDKKINGRTVLALKGMPGLLGKGTDVENAIAVANVSESLWEATGRVFDTRSTPPPPRLRPRGQEIPEEPPVGTVSGNEVVVAGESSRRSTLRPRPARQIPEVLTVVRRNGNKVAEASASTRRSTLRPRPARQIPEVLTVDRRNGKKVAEASPRTRRATLRPRKARKISEVPPVGGGTEKKVEVASASSNTTGTTNLRPRRKIIRPLSVVVNPKKESSQKVDRKGVKRSTRSVKDIPIPSKMLVLEPDTSSGAKANRVPSVPIPTLDNIRKSNYLLKEAAIANGTNEFYKAEELLDRAILLNPLNCEAFLARGDLFMKMGLAAQAFPDYLAIKNIDTQKFTPIVVGKLKAALHWRKVSPVTCYSILGVDNRASNEEIRVMFRKLAKKYHSDKNVGASKEEKVELNKNFRKVHESFSILKEPALRAEYDLKLSRPTYGYQRSYCRV